MKNTILLSILIANILACHSKKEYSSHFYKDYSLLSYQGVNAIEDGRKTKFPFVEILDRPEFFKILVYISTTDSISIQSNENNQYRIFKFNKNDSKYGLLPSYLVLNKRSNNLVSYDFLDNTITVDSMINVFKGEFDTSHYCIVSGTIKAKDSAGIWETLLEGHEIPIDTENITVYQKHTFNGSLIDYLNLGKK